MRLAWFSPWTPDRGDAAGRSADAVPALAARGFTIDVFVDERRVPVSTLETTSPAAAGEVRVAGAHDFVWRHARAPYNLGVYHLADDAASDFVWPYLFHFPGLTVLHDGRLHPSRSRSLLAQRRFDDYRAEFIWNHPDVAPAAAELAINGYEGAFSCQWPMVRAVLAGSREVVTHNRGAISELEAAGAGISIGYVTAGDGHGIATRDAADTARKRLRATLGLPEDAVVFGVFDAPAVDRRVPQILRAFAGARARNANVRLLLAGADARDAAVTSLIAELGLGESVLSVDAGVATDDELVASADVTLALRWPAALDTPGTWLRALAAGRASVVLDLVHLADIPALDPRTWRRHAPAETSAAAEDDAVTVAVDIMDEDHSLRLALQRLAIDAPLRERLGRAGRRYWHAHHGIERMIDDYARAIDRAAGAPAPHMTLPAHLTPDPLAYARSLVEAFGDAATGTIASLGRPGV